MSDFNYIHIDRKFLPPAPEGMDHCWGRFQSKSLYYQHGAYVIDQWGQLWHRDESALAPQTMMPLIGDLIGYTSDGHGPTLREWAYVLTFADGQLMSVNSSNKHTTGLAPEPMPAYGLVGPGASRPFVVKHEGDAVVASVSVIHAAGKVIVVQVEMETKGCHLLSESLTPLHILAPDHGNPTILSIPSLEGFECQCVTLHARYAFRLCGLLRE